MRAYKGFNSELTSVMGDGKKENCVFKLGETKRVESSKTVRSGFHCCENPFECLGYYPVDGKNRYFEVEAAGSIDEDGSERIACTEITLIRELDIAELALAGMAYMIMHPHRSGWQQSHRGAEVHKDKSKPEKKKKVEPIRKVAPVQPKKEPSKEPEHLKDIRHETIPEHAIDQEEKESETVMVEVVPGVKVEVDVEKASEAAEQEIKKAENLINPEREPISEDTYNEQMKRLKELCMMKLNSISGCIAMNLWLKSRQHMKELDELINQLEDLDNTPVIEEE